ncbi:hypothetical protein JHN63_19640 [Streptomyces sp. MBT65]|uniref:hypothetical protein n=1 Tax=Streptomyces sp. MBT65 TaxID=1488395 RepID=UPI00190B1BDB|nr:hypothetical protein [Streptomyces sp. MBT65]MBK3575990.1 hypothetical protein [Streptomyces sp. MBT65]
MDEAISAIEGTIAALRKKLKKGRWTPSSRELSCASEMLNTDTMYSDSDAIVRGLVFANVYEGPGVRLSRRKHGRFFAMLMDASILLQDASFALIDEGCQHLIRELRALMEEVRETDEPRVVGLFWLRDTDSSPVRFTEP